MRDEAIIQAISQYNSNLEKEFNEKKEEIFKRAFKNYISNSQKDLYQQYNEKFNFTSDKNYIETSFKNYVAEREWTVKNMGAIEKEQERRKKYYKRFCENVADSLKELQELKTKYDEFRACNDFIIAAHTNPTNWNTILKPSLSSTKKNMRIPKGVKTLDELCHYVKRNLDEPLEEILIKKEINLET